MYTLLAGGPHASDRNEVSKRGSSLRVPFIELPAICTIEVRYIFMSCESLDSILTYRAL